MNYQKIPAQTVQQLYDRIALLEWFERNDEADDADLAELYRLKKMVGHG